MTVAGVRGLTGETPLKARKTTMLNRCDRLQTDVQGRLAAIRGYLGDDC